MKHTPYKKPSLLASGLFLLIAVGLIGLVSLTRPRPFPASPAVPHPLETLSPVPSPTSPPLNPLFPATYDNILHTPEEIVQIAFSPDGSLIAGMGEFKAYLWELNSQKTESYREFSSPYNNYPYGILAISADNKILYRANAYENPDPTVGFTVGGIERWDISTGDSIYPIWTAPENYNFGHARHLDFDLEHNIFNYFYQLDDAGCLRTNTYFHQWDAATGKLLPTWIYFSYYEQLLHFASSSSYLAFEIADTVCDPYDPEKRKILVFNTDEISVATLPSPGHDGLHGMKFSPDSHYLAGLGYEFKNRTWYFLIVWKDFKEVIRMRQLNMMQSFQISPDSRYLYLQIYTKSYPQEGIYHPQFEVIDLASNDWIATIDLNMWDESQSNGIPFAISPDGKHLVCASADQIFFIPLPDWETVVHQN